MLAIDYRPSFQNSLKKVFKKYPHSQERINKEIDKLKKKPLQGNSYPGFGKFDVRKIRLSLSEYRISERKGLRLIYLYIPNKEKVIPLVIYQKNEYASEDKIKKEIIKRIKEIANEFNRNR